MNERKPFTPLQYWASNDLPEWACRIITRSPERIFALPSEMVLLPGNSVYFDTARMWSDGVLGATQRWNDDGELTMNYPHYLIEDWQDWGDDGHVVYQICGYAVLNAEDAQAFHTAARVATDRWEFPYIEYREDEFNKAVVAEMKNQMKGTTK
jgi:hypothetical protein